MGVWVQVQFDMRWNMPAVSRVEEVAKERFRLLPGRNTSVAPVAKFYVLYFESYADAHSASRDLPTRLRTREQWPADASCTATVLSMRAAQEAVNSAAAARRGAAPAAAPARAPYTPWPSAPATAGTAAAAPPVYVVQQPAQQRPAPPPPPMAAYVMPTAAQAAAVPPGTVLQPGPPAMPDLAAAAPYGGPVAAAASPPAPPAAAPAATAAAPPLIGGVDISALGSILAQAGGDGAGEDDKAQEMLGLLSQLGSATGKE